MPNININRRVIFQNRESYLGVPIGGYLSKDFTGSGSLDDWTTVATTATFTPSASGLVITGGGATFGQYIKYNLIYSALEKYNIVLTFIVDENTATSTGLWVGTYGASALGNCCRFFCATGASKGKVDIYSSTAVSLVQSATGLNFNVGDRIRLTFDRNQQVFTATAENLTLGGTVSATYTIALTAVETASAAATIQYAIGNLRGTQTIESISITSQSLKKTWVNFVGDSITAGKFAGSLSNRFSNMTMATSSKVYQVTGGPGDRTAYILNRMPEILLMNPKYVVLSIGKNDVRAGVSSAVYTANYTSIRNQIAAAGITVIHLLSTPEDALVLTTLNNHINTMNSTYGDVVIDVFTPLKDGSNQLDAAYDSGDGIHPNAAGHAYMASIISSGAPFIL